METWVQLASNVGKQETNSVAYVCIIYHGGQMVVFQTRKREADDVLRS